MTNKNKLIILFATLFLTYSLYAVEVEEYAAIEVYGIYEVYECSIDTIYAMGHGESTDLHGGKLVITVTNDEVDVKSDRKGVDSGLLRLVVRTEVEIVAINETMQFTYQIYANKYSFTTGNGDSRFRGGVGHAGRQLLVYGPCKDI
jgi:hypothetical protein